MSAADQKDKKFIPEWVFVLVLLAAVASIGLFRLTRQIKRAAHPVISEIQALNQTGEKDEDGDLSDWIEIWNPTDETINLGGYYLTDDFRRLRRWQFPQRKLTPGEFLVVFASGKDRRISTNELHTNFRLSPEGEYLVLVAPDGKRRVHELLPKFPRQIGGNSFGIRPEFFQIEGMRLSRKLEDMSFLLDPTPGAPNQSEMLGVVKNVSFSLKRGFFFNSTNVALATSTHGADIRFTTDGTKPSETNGVLYVEPVPIDSTTLLRAVAYRSGFQSSRVGSHTYMFPAKETRKLNPEISSSEFEEVMAGFMDLPTISLMIPDSQIWRSYDAGQVLRSSLELIDPVEGESKQIDCGIRISSLGPLTFGDRYKNSFRIYIDDRFGDSAFNYRLFGRRKPRSFTDLVLIGGTKTLNAEMSLQSLVSDAWTRASASSLNLEAARSRFVHVFLNGSYSGIYNLAERPETPFVSKSRQTVEPNFDVRIGRQQIAGDSIAWNALNATVVAVEQGIGSIESLVSAINLDSFIDFALLEAYTKSEEQVGGHQWMAVRSRSRNAPTDFMGTFVVTALTDDFPEKTSTSETSVPFRIFKALSGDDVIRKEIRRRAKEILTDQGAMSADQVLDRFRFLARQLNHSISAERLRWNTASNSLDSIEEFLQTRSKSVLNQFESSVTE